MHVSLHPERELVHSPRCVLHRRIRSNLAALYQAEQTIEQKLRTQSDVTTARLRTVMDQLEVAWTVSGLFVRRRIFTICCAATGRIFGIPVRGPDETRVQSDSESSDQAKVLNVIGL